MQTGYPHAIQGIIYDNDGLLLDTENLYAKVHHQMTGHVLDWDFRRRLLGRTGPDACALIVQEYNMDEDPLSFLARRDVELRKLFPTAKLFPGAEAVVRFTRSLRLPTALATSSHRRNFLTKIVNHTEFYTQFDSVICGDEVSAGKPNPELFLKSMNAIGLTEPRSVLVFEDAPLGVKAANSAGMSVVMIPDPELDLEPALAEVDAHPTFVWKSLLDIDWSMFNFVGRQ
jgi:pseudouridine-5'-monophosphatase